MLQHAEREWAASRNTLLEQMLPEEWQHAKLGPVPQLVRSVLVNGWTEPNAEGQDEQTNWFDLISLFFIEALKNDPRVKTIYLSSSVATILGELRAFRTEWMQAGQRTARPPFKAPTAPDYFVGRVDVLAALRDRLGQPGTVVPFIGMPGLGKTTLALAFAHQYKGDFDGVYWVSCAGLSLSAAATELALQLGIKAKGELHQVLADVRGRCSAEHYLLVLDNVESNDFRELALQQGSTSVLVTTRNAGLPFLARFRRPNLDVLTPEECLDLFGQYLGTEELSRQKSAYGDLAELLGRLPLGVAVAASLLQNDVRYALERLLRETRLHRLSHGEHDIDHLLGAAIQAAGTDARRLLGAMAVCAPAGFCFLPAAEVREFDEPAGLEALQEFDRARWSRKSAGRSGAIDCTR
jgi:hypothetical protein